jgi:hypothetical protein
LLITGHQAFQCTNFGAAIHQLSYGMQEINRDRPRFGISLWCCLLTPPLLLAATPCGIRLYAVTQLPVGYPVQEGLQGNAASCIEHLHFPEIVHDRVHCCVMERVISHRRPASAEASLE